MKGVPGLDNGLDSTCAKLMGEMMASLAQRFLTEVKAQDKKGSGITADEVNNITMLVPRSNKLHFVRYLLYCMIMINMVNVFTLIIVHFNYETYN